MIIGKFINSIFNISIIFSSFMLLITIPYGSSQEDINNSQTKDLKLRQELQQQFNQLSPEKQETIFSLFQKEAQKAFMEASPEEQELMIQRSQQDLRDASPEEQELIIQQMKQMFPPQIVEKLLPAEKK